MIKTSNRYNKAIATQGRKTSVRIKLRAYSGGNMEQQLIGANSATQVPFPASPKINGEYAVLDGSWRLGEQMLAGQVDAGITADYACLDGKWRLGERRIMSRNDPRNGVWSQELSREDGGFDRPLEFRTRCMLGTEPDVMSFLGLEIGMDNIYGEHATQIRVQTYDVLGGLLSDETYDNEGSVLVLDQAYNDIHEIRISILAWSAPGVHAKVSSLYLGRRLEITDADIVSVDLLEEVGAEDSTGLAALSCNELTVDVFSRALQGYVPPSGSEIRAEIGVQVDSGAYEYVDCGVYYIDSVETSDSQVTTKIAATDVTRNLAEGKFSLPAPVQITAYELITAAYDWVGRIDPALLRIEFGAARCDGMPRRDFLAECVGVCGYNAYVGKDGRLQVRQVAAQEPVAVVAYKDIYGIKTVDAPMFRRLAVSYYVKRDDGDSLDELTEETPNRINALGSGTLRVQSKLLSNDREALGCGDRVLQYLCNMRAGREITWRGNPALELGDTINMEDIDGQQMVGVIYRNKYQYKGYLQCTTTIKGVDYNGLADT